MQLQASTHKHTDHIDVEQRGKDRRGSKTSKAKNLQEKKKSEAVVAYFLE